MDNTKLSQPRQVGTSGAASLTARHQHQPGLDRVGVVVSIYVVGQVGVDSLRPNNHSNANYRKPIQCLPGEMQVRDLDGKLVPGYRTLNELGMTPQRRGILYQRLFSSEEEDLISEPYEVQQALKRVSRAIEGLKARMTVSWILGSMT